MIKRPNLTKRVLPAAIALGLLAPAGFIPAVQAQEVEGLEEIVGRSKYRRPQDDRS